MHTVFDLISEQSAYQPLNNFFFFKSDLISGPPLNIRPTTPTVNDNIDATPSPDRSCTISYSSMEIHMAAVP